MIIDICKAGPLKSSKTIANKSLAGKIPNNNTQINKKKKKKKKKKNDLILISLFPK